MTISLTLKYVKVPIMSIYSLHSYHMPTNMKDSKTLRSSYTKWQIIKPYLRLSDDQFALLYDKYGQNTIQYDHMYVQTTPILLFRRTNKNCYVNIIQHANAKRITSIFVFSYYNNINIPGTLFSTNEYF